MQLTQGKWYRVTVIDHYTVSPAQTLKEALSTEPVYIRLSGKYLGMNETENYYVFSRDITLDKDEEKYETFNAIVGTIVECVELKAPLKRKGPIKKYVKLKGED